MAKRYLDEQGNPIQESAKPVAAAGKRYLDDQGEPIQAAQTEQNEAPTPKPSALSRFVTGVAQTTIQPFKEIKNLQDQNVHEHGQALGTLKTYWDIGKGILMESNDHAVKALQSLGQGEFGEALQHAPGAIPLIGPAAVQASEEMEAGNVAGGIGQAVGLVIGAKSPAIAKGALKAGKVTVNAGRSAYRALTKPTDPTTVGLIRSLKLNDARVLNETTPGGETALRRAAGDIKATGIKVSGVEDLLKASQAALAKNREAWAAWMQRAERIGVRVSGHPIVKATSDAIAETVSPQNRAAIINEANRIYGRDLTPTQLEKLLKEKNGELHAFESKDAAVRAAAEQAGAQTGRSAAVLKAQVEAIRNQLYEILDPQNKGAGPREIQSRYGSIKNIRDAAIEQRTAIAAEKPMSRKGNIFQKGQAVGNAVKFDFEAASRRWSGTDNLIQRAIAAAPDTTPYPMPAAVTPRGLIGPGARPMGPAPDTSGVRGVPAQYGTSTGARALPPASTIMAEAAPDTSAVTGQPAQMGTATGVRSLPPQRGFTQGTVSPASGEGNLPVTDQSGVSTYNLQKNIVRDPRTGRMKVVYGELSDSNPRMGQGEPTAPPNAGPKKGGAIAEAEQIMKSKKGGRFTEAKPKVNLPDSDKIFDALDQAHQDAVKNYTGTSDGLNTALRAGGPLKPNDARAVKLIDEAIDSAPPLSENIIVHRLIDPDAAAKLKIGDYYKDKGFVSTSTKDGIEVVRKGLNDQSGIDDMVKISIEVPRGTKVLPANGKWNNYFADQQEILLPRNGSWKIRAIEGQEGKAITLYRGTGKGGGGRTPSQFGEGEYWTPDKQVAETYGSQVAQETVTFKKPYEFTLPNKVDYKAELKAEFGTSNPKMISELLIKKGYDALIVKNVPYMRRHPNGETVSGRTTEVIKLKSAAVEAAGKMKKPAVKAESHGGTTDAWTLSGPGGGSMEVTFKKNSVYIDQIRVPKEAQGKGYASALYDKLGEMMKQRGIPGDKITGNIQASNKAQILHLRARAAKIAGKGKKQQQVYDID